VEGQDETRNSETNSVRIYATSQAYYLLGEIMVARCEQRHTPNMEMIVQSEGALDSVRLKERRRGPHYSSALTEATCTESYLLALKHRIKKNEECTL
jgi:hypothetical protein